MINLARRASKAAALLQAQELDPARSPVSVVSLAPEGHPSPLHHHPGCQGVEMVSHHQTLFKYLSKFHFTTLKSPADLISAERFLALEVLEEVLEVLPSVARLVKCREAWTIPAAGGIIPIRLRNIPQETDHRARSHVPSNSRSKISMAARRSI